jgi:3',5'-cyclic-AMP phosphodiesterase
MLIAQLSDVHVGGGRYREELLRAAIEEINTAEPDLVVVAGDLTDEGYPDQYPLAKEELAALACPLIVRVPGNHDARNVGYLHFEDSFGARDSRLRLELDRLKIALVAVDSSKPDLDEGEIGREHYGWIEGGFAGEADLRVFVCHHHLVPVPGTGPRAKPGDAGDVLSLLRQCEVDLVLSEPPRPLRLADRGHAARPLRHRLHAAHARVPQPRLQPRARRGGADLRRALRPPRRAAEPG